MTTDISIYWVATGFSDSARRFRLSVVQTFETSILAALSASEHYYPTNYRFPDIEMSSIKPQKSDIRVELEDLEIQNYEQKSFISLDALQQLLTESRVVSLISDLSENGDIEVWQQAELSRIIVNNGLRVFATLLSFSRSDLIVKFKETDHFAHSQLDSRLPLSQDSLKMIVHDEKSSAKFYKHQWKFLAPLFRADQSHRELQDNVILPFISCERLGEGGFGEVHKMSLIASYQDLMPEGRSQV